MITKEEILAYLREIKPQLFKEFQLNKIGLFGSYARNEATENSDIDLLVEFDPYTDDLSEKKSMIKMLVREKFDKEVDLCREKYIKPYFRSQILQSVIYV